MAEESTASPLSGLLSGLPSLPGPSSMATSGVNASFGDIRNALTLPNRSGESVNWQLPAAVGVGLLLAFLLRRKK